MSQVLRDMCHVCVVSVDLGGGVVGLGCHVSFVVPSFVSLCEFYAAVVSRVLKGFAFMSLSSLMCVVPSPVWIG